MLQVPPQHIVGRRLYYGKQRRRGDAQTSHLPVRSVAPARDNVTHCRFAGFYRGVGFPIRGSDVSILRASGREEPCRAKFLTTVSNGDMLKVRLAGGGGHGNPFERDPEAVLDDVLEEKMSVEHARNAYGVVISGCPLAVDYAATGRGQRHRTPDVDNGGSGR